MSDKATDYAKTVWERTPEGRYKKDIKFRNLVDMMESYMHAGDFTPSELREAALLGAIHFEARTIRHVFGHTMTADTARRCQSLVDEIYKAIQTDERPFHNPEHYR